jgi:hypothetical protein
MRPIGELLKRESPVTLARELVLRARRDWDKKRILAQMHQPCPVRFHRLHYYAPGGAEFTAQTRACMTGFASEICEGRFPFLGYGTVTLGFPPQWNVDFVSGKEWSQTAADMRGYVRHDGSDVKVPWELSRLQFLPILGKAHLLTGELRYREAGKRLLSNWITQNPVGVGVNWTLAMEAALRAMSICLFLDLLGPFRSEEQRWLEQVTRCLWQHLVFIEAHLEFSHLMRSNHYLSNIVGLYCLSVFLDGNGMASRRHTYKRRVEEEIEHQVHPDGGDYESSLGYHVLVMQMFTSALLLTRAARMTSDSGFSQRLKLMYQLTGEVASSAGQLPHVGDCDDGRVELMVDDLQQMLFVPVEGRNSLRVPSLLGVGSALFGGQSDLLEDAKWYGLSRANAAARAPKRTAPDRVMKVFPQSGIATAKRGDFDVLFFAMPNSIAGKGSHTHNDKLSLVVRIAGDEALCDSGTCCYTRDAGERNRFRATAAHNTLLVDDCEQNRILPENHSLFSIGNDARVSSIQAEQSDGAFVFRASHTGYRNLGVAHSRTVKLVDETLIMVEDEVAGTGKHRLEMNWQLSYGWRLAGIEEIESRTVCRIEGAHPFTMTFSAPVPLQVASCQRRVSRTFGSAVPTHRIRVLAECALPVTLLTSISRTEPVQPFQGTRCQ